MKTFSTKIMPVLVRKRMAVDAASGGNHKEWRYIDVPKNMECQGYIISYRGKEVMFYVPVSYMNGTSTRSWICNENGERINAIWQHGRYGSMEHIEPAIWDFKAERFVQKIAYCEGKIKDSFKYMTRVLF